MVVTTCDATARTTGFLGLGAGEQQIAFAARNDGDVGTHTTMVISAQHQRDEENQIVLHRERVWIEAHQSATITTVIPNEQLGGIRQFRCRAIPAPVLQPQRAMCPTCSGRGLVPDDRGQ